VLFIFSSIIFYVLIDQWREIVMRTLIILLCCFLGACNPVQDNQPIQETVNIPSETIIVTGEPMSEATPEKFNQYSQQPEDVNLIRANAFLDSSDILIMESYPVQINLHLMGSLPTPCHQLRLNISQPDTENRILIDLYSVVDPDKICAQMLQAFDVNIPLGSFPAGNYSIWINGSKIGNFDA
jgi:hypothetical protein